MAVVDANSSTLSS